MYLKIHETSNGKIIAACDENLMDRVLEDGKRILDLKKYRDFYNGKKVDKKEFQKVLADLSDSSSANLVGKEVIKIVLNMKLIDKNQIDYIAKTPFVQIYNI